MVFVCFRTYCFIKLVLVHVPDILNQSPSLWRATYTIVIISHAGKRWWSWFAILEHVGMLVYNNVVPSGNLGANRIVVPLLISYRFFFPVVTAFSSLLLLIKCPKQRDCLRLMWLFSLRISYAS